MFHFLGIFMARTWPLWLVAWIASLAILTMTAPAWEEVAPDREFGFLPQDMPSQRGEELSRRAFPGDWHPGDVVLVLIRAKEELRDEDRDFVKDVVSPALLQLAQQEGGLANPDDMASQKPKSGAPRSSRNPIIHSIRTLHDKGSGALVVSADRQATLVQVNRNV